MAETTKIRPNGRTKEGFEAYIITAAGDVWTCWGRGGRVWKLTDEWKVKVPDKSDKGHLRIELRSGNGTIQRFFIHCLVLELYVGPCPDGMEACHGDGNPENNNVDNLRWDTPVSNWADRKRHGRGCEGVKNPGGGKLDDEQIQGIRNMRGQGFTLKDISEIYNVSKAMVSRIARREAWSHVR